MKETVVYDVVITLIGLYQETNEVVFCDVAYFDKVKASEQEAVLGQILDDFRAKSLERDVASHRIQTNVSFMGAVNDYRKEQIEEAQENLIKTMEVNVPF